MKRVSLIAPCRNEAAHIDAFCASVAAQRLPDGWALDVVIADGQSDDGTRAALDALAARDARFAVIANPQRIVSAGLNRALAAAKGDVIVRMDVHTTYDPDYVAACIATLERTGADAAGGPWRADASGTAEGSTERAIAAAFQSRWLAGGARSRDLGYDGPVDTVYLGSWPRATFARFGGFDEALVRNQDDEHNLRIVLGGGRVWQSPAIRSRYRPRAAVGALFRQYLQYGYWKPFVIRKHGQPAALRHLVPGLYVAALAGLALAAVAGAPAWPAAALAAAYAAANVAASAAVAAGSSWRLLPRLPAVIAAYHFGYGIGSVLGWVDVIAGAKAGRAWFARLTR